MTKIERSECPPVLQKDPGRFVEGDYKKEEVKSELLKMQHGKCCYCERMIKDLPPREREVDHYMPRKHDSFKDTSGEPQWHLANKWTNLLYSCRACNNIKGKKSPFNDSTGTREIIDPSYDDPEDHIDFVIEDIIVRYKPKDESPLGRLTINHLKLNDTNDRSDLFKDFRRLVPEIEALLFIPLVDAILDGDNTEIDKRKRALLRHMSSDHSFTGFIRRFVERRLRKLNDVDLPKLEALYGKSYTRIDIDIPKGHVIIH